MDNLFNEVTFVLFKLGFRPKLAGFNYLRDAILLYFENKNFEEVYSQVANKYKTTSLLTERLIRKSISDAYETGGLLALNDVCGNLVYANSFHWSNSQLIATLVEVVKLKDLRDKLLKVD